MSNRFHVRPIADSHCDSLNPNCLIIATSDLVQAHWHASHNCCAYGAGILDTETGLLDVGFGFGNPCPEDLF